MLTVGVTSAGEDETRRLGAALASVLRPGDVVRVDGPLGAGKTTLIRAVATALGADAGMVASPTFVIVNEYPAPGADVAHVDAYRLSGPDDLDALGWDRLGADTITLVEWAERIAGALPGDSAHVTINASAEHEREITIELPEAWRDRPGLEALAPGVTRCPTTGLAVSPEDPHYPFASDRARLADLHAWMSERYRVERSIGPQDQD